MKAPALFSALGFALLFSACQKDKPLAPAVSSDAFAPLPSERCGCTAPEESKIEKMTDGTVGISWSNVSEAAGYRLELKSGGFESEADGQSDIHVFEMTENNHLVLSNLAPDTRYYYRLTSLCGHFGGSQTVSCNSTLDYFDMKPPVIGDPGYDTPTLSKFGTPPAQ